MPTKRRRRSRALSLDGTAREHLETGGRGHLFALPLSGCPLCNAGDDAARAMWQAHRHAVLAGWKHPFPCWSAVKFDGKAAALPEDWPEDPDRSAYWAWRSIRESLDYA